MTKKVAEETGLCKTCAAYKKKREKCISMTDYGRDICPRLYEREVANVKSSKG